MAIRRFQRSTRPRLRSPRKHPRFRLGAVGVALGALLLVINFAGAVNVGGFEIDAGNVAQEHALYSGNDGGDDWAEGSSGSGVFEASASAPHTAAADCYGSNIDKVLEPSTLICDGNSDTKFKATEPERNIVSPSGKTPDDVWPVKPGNVRPKNDFSHAYVHASTVDSPCDADTIANNLVLHLGGHVGDNEGSHFWGFEFNGTAPAGFASLKANDGSSFNLDFNRQVGDLLISFTVPGNASDPVSLDLFSVSGFQADGDAIFTPATAVPGCPGGSPQGFTLMATNSSNDVEAPPWNVPVCDPTADNASNSCRLANGTTNAEDLLAPRDFAEASVDLTAFGINPCFTNVIFTSRSSHVLEGADIQDVGGGDFPLCGKKAGVKFHDQDANGSQGSSEPGLNGWTMKLYRDADGDDVLDASEATAINTTTTSTIGGVVGSYQFLSLANGDYIVCEVLQSGWSQSLPNSGTSDLADCTSESGDSTLGAAGYAFTMSGPDHTGNDFGNFQNGTKSGTKFVDSNGDGDRDTGEPGLAGVEIHLVGTDGLGNAVHLHDTTDVNGDYSISAPPGSYTACETVPTGYTQSYPTATTAGSVACVAPHDGRGWSVTLTSGSTDSGNDFGNFQNGTKSGTKFVDSNGDGDRDMGEPGLAGVEIHLVGTDGLGNAVHEHDTTDANGAYSISAPPGSYTACETVPTGYTQSYPKATTAGSVACVAPHDGRGWSVTLTSGSTDSGNDFGNFQNATISGQKFKDADADGVKDMGETGLGTWVIHLFGTDGAGTAVHQLATTDANGNYSFTVAPGTYTVCEQVSGKPGWVQSAPTSGANCTAHTDMSTITPGAVGYSVTATSGGTTSSRDFGNTPLSRATVTFESLADLPNGNDATRATSISCVDAASASVGSASNANTLTTGNVKTNQSSLVCTITFVDP